MAKNKKESLRKAEKTTPTTFEIVKGDVFEKFFTAKGNTIFMHGANCQKIMGAGVALGVAQRISPLRFLDMFDVRTSQERFGSFSSCNLGGPEGEMKIGVNLYTQYNPGPNFNENALINSLRAFIFNISKQHRSKFTIYLPFIGCGIGGGDWDVVRPILKRELADFNVVVVEYDKDIK